MTFDDIESRYKSHRSGVKQHQEQVVRFTHKTSSISYVAFNHDIGSSSPYLTLSLLILLTGISCSFAQQLGLQEPDLDQLRPTLIGFRCDQSGFLETNGVCVIEADSPATLILYGESFTTDTIIAFTPQPLKPKDVEPAQHHRAQRPTSADDGQWPTTTTIEQQSKSGRETSSHARSYTPGEHTKTWHPRATNFVKQTRPRKEYNFDCTDNNRLASIPLTSENILSPNVAQITIRLPELSASSGGRLYYYFCIKQPRITSGNSSRTTIASPEANVSSVNVVAQDPLALKWIHQGDDWWLTLKVEPPILSVTNDCLLIGFLLFLSAVTSGLNLGLMSLDMNELAVISTSGDQRERSYARTIAPLRKRGNYLLCSLLLGNVLVNSTLTVILEELTTGLIAIIASTLAIVILGEIVPQAFCARNGLAIGARTIYLTYAFMIITFPLSYPISRLLDWVLGEEKGNVYDRERLMEFIKITGHHTQLDAEEVAIISGALKLKKIKVDQIMTRIEDVFMLPIDCKLDRETLKRIIEKGYSRIPVYEFGDRKQIIALILAKDLALIDPDDHTPIASMLMYCKHPLIFIEDDVTLDVALNEFKTGKSHMAVVRQIYDDGEVDKYYEAIGVVTLEDVIEELLQTEINDETDTLSDNRRKRRRPNAQVAHLFNNEVFTGTSNSQVTANTSSASISNIYSDSSAAPTTTNHRHHHHHHHQQQQHGVVSGLAAANLLMLEHHGRNSSGGGNASTSLVQQELHQQPATSQDPDGKQIDAIEYCTNVIVAQALESSMEKPIEQRQPLGQSTPKSNKQPRQPQDDELEKRDSHEQQPPTR